MNEPPRASRSRLTRIIRVIVLLGAFGVCAASLLGHLGRFGLVFELMSHFRVQYAVLLVAACGALFVLKSFKTAIIVGLVALTDVAAVAPYVGPVGHAALAGQGDPASSPIRLLSQNVNTSNQHYAEVLELIAAEQPDMVLLLEVDARWMEQLKSLDAAYPYSCSSPRTDNFGIALWSRFELKDTRIEPMTEARVPTIMTDVAAPGGRFRFIGTHPLPPVSSRYVALRNEQLGLIAAEVSSNHEWPTIVAGDLNATPWTGAFRDLLRVGRLQDLSRGFGPQRTWPASNWMMRIPIDHVLATDGITVVNHGVGSDVGSDHLGLIADLLIDTSP